LNSDNSDFWRSVEEIDEEVDYETLAIETKCLHLETEKTMHLVDFAKAPFHQFPIEDIESLFDLATSQALANIAVTVCPLCEITVRQPFL
jgi:hypothetical protein